jgi:DNA invertase Pin-like site-specific DNA recombinase
MKKAVAYIRASTDEAKQSNSFAVQKAIIEEFASRNGYSIEIVFSEYSSGRDDERTEFNNALKYCISNNAFLIAYRVDRVARTMSIFSRIQDALPMLRFANLGDIQPNLLLISVLLAVATNESQTTSTRVSAAMQHLKKEGRVFGNPNINTNCRPLGLEAIKNNAKQYNNRIKSIVDDLRLAGYTEFNSILDQINYLGVKTRSGKSWSYQNLYRVLHS